MPEEKDLISFLRDANDITKLLTGKSIPDLARKSAELFGKEAVKNLLQEHKAPSDSPYAVLGVRPDAATIVIKASYRALQKMYADNDKKLEEVKEAYLKILSDRGEG